MQDKRSEPANSAAIRKGDPEDLKEGEDFYYDGPYLVFTEKYHLKRGYCCNSGCRHCPYREKPSSGSEIDG